VVVGDVDRDGRPDVVLTRSYADRGSAVLVLTRRDGRWQVMGESTPLGRPQRWQHVLAVADLDGGGPVVLTVRTPHVGGVLQALRLRGLVLEPVAMHTGVSSHALGSRNLQQAATVDLDGNGRPEVVVPAPARDALLGLELRGSLFEERWRLPLDGPLGSNVLAADLDGDGRPEVAVADTSTLRVLSSAREERR
ncbi:MAG TPA: VCBS repeat-containing protein, partial [Methylomirabilota bacterium]|nr:VCBS repeat-containing protein [Methylomirabilota bacterium]